MYAITSIIKRKKYTQTKTYDRLIPIIRHTTLIWAVKRNIHKWEIDKNCKISKNEQVTYKNVKSELKTKCPKTTIYYCFITIEKVDK